jgi:ABC-type siderophore export system fused ATPase/permease subunit
MYDLMAATTGKIVFVLRARTAGTWHRCDVERTLRFANLDILRMLTRDIENIAAQPVIEFLDRCL